MACDSWDPDTEVHDSFFGQPNRNRLTANTRIEGMTGTGGMLDMPLTSGYRKHSHDNAF